MPDKRFYHVSSAVVSVAPESRQAVLAALPAVQGVEVHAGVEAHALQHPGEVLGGDVAGGVGGEGAAAHPADGGVEA